MYIEAYMLTLATTGILAKRERGAEGIPSWLSKASKD